MKASTFLLMVYWCLGLYVITNATKGCTISPQEAIYLTIIWPIVKENGGIKCENKK